MNLHGIVRGHITAVNPDSDIPWQSSTGATVAAGGKQTPTWASAVTVQGQIQAAPQEMLRKYNLLQAQGIFRTVYFYGQIQAINRVGAKGGDLLSFPEVPEGTNRTWLVVQVPEQWPDWCCVLVSLQTDPNNPP